MTLAIAETSLTTQSGTLAVARRSLTTGFGTLAVAKSTLATGLGTPAKSIGPMHFLDPVLAPHPNNQIEGQNET